MIKNNLMNFIKRYWQAPMTYKEFKVWIFLMGFTRTHTKIEKSEKHEHKQEGAHIYLYPSTEEASIYIKGSHLFIKKENAFRNVTFDECVRFLKKELL